MQTLTERGLVEAIGRAEVVGRPMTYGTSALFLEYFGLRGLEDLPAADELRKIVVEKPPAPLTADPGLATAPPEGLKAEEQKTETAERAGANVKFYETIWVILLLVGVAFSATAQIDTNNRRDLRPRSFCLRARTGRMVRASASVLLQKARPRVMKSPMLEQRLGANTS